ncbi:MAG: PEP-CTERM sorting domain-containing protein, partial [Planctomycetes bacterium]|nr:PEP-CTERM sorting domain-containing protein [Planctomycetota bacterium]
SMFYPGCSAAGWLVIEVDLAETDSSFTLTQHPTPEPASMILTAAGLPLLLRRKQRQNAAKS